MPTFTTELNISQLYYLRDFQQAFNLSLRLLCPSRFSRISAAEIPMDVIQYDPKMTLVWDNVSREVAETMMRIVLQTGTRYWGGVLADGTKRSVRTSTYAAPSCSVGGAEYLRLISGLKGETVQQLNWRRAVMRWKNDTEVSSDRIL